MMHGVPLERRTVIVPVNGNKSSPIRRFLQRHPMIRIFVLTVAFSTALALVGAVINLAISHIPGNSAGSNPLSGVQVPIPVKSPSSPPPAMQQQPVPYSVGSCLSGRFSGKTPKNVIGAPCSSRGAKYQIIKKFPGATNPLVCNGIHGAKMGYLEEYTENGIPYERYVYCLGEISQ